MQYTTHLEIFLGTFIKFLPKTLKRLLWNIPAVYQEEFLQVFYQELLSFHSNLSFVILLEIATKLLQEYLQRTSQQFLQKLLQHLFFVIFQRLPAEGSPVLSGILSKIPQNIILSEIYSVIRLKKITKAFFGFCRISFRNSSLHWLQTIHSEMVKEILLRNP